MDFLVTSDEARNRINICTSCVHFKRGFCGTPVIGKTVKHEGKDVKLCGCEMHIKTELVSSQCPIGKWGYGKLKFEQIARAKRLLDIYTENGKIKNVSINANMLTDLWYQLTGEHKKVNCSGCAKEIINGLQRLVKQHGHDKNK